GFLPPWTLPKLARNLPAAKWVCLLGRIPRGMPAFLKRNVGALMRWLPKRLLIFVLLVGVVVALGFQVRSWWQQRSLPKYLTVVVSRGRVETVVNSTGTVKPVLSVSVGAFTSGPIAKVYVDFNSVVKKDQLLAVIDPKLFEATVERDRAALEIQ